VVVDSILAHGGELVPPPLTPERWLSSWQVEPAVLVLLVLAGGLYMWGVVRLGRAGVGWSWWRTVWWLSGLLIVFLATSSVVAVYDTTLFSVHSVQHMLLQMFAPVPLALAAPVTLALRALPAVGRRLLVGLLHGRYVRVVAHPLVVFGLFVATPFALYYTPWYEATLRHEWLHHLNHVHFLAVGLLLYMILLGVDPLPHRVPFVYRFMMIVAVGVSHVLLGIPIMMGTDVFAEDFYRALDRGWGPSLVDDQQTGGAILWLLGDLTVVGFLVGFLGQWMRADEREARRVDRQLDRRYGADATTPPWWVAGRR
jgi:cytochrome c oxidase assembly factor CtaG